MLTLVPPRAPAAQPQADARPVFARGADAAAWDAALAEILAEPRRIRLAFQPIADLRRGIVTGFEALARFDSSMSAGPEQWFQEAERRGLALTLEAAAAARALEAVGSLPPNCFLSLNVSPPLLTSPLWGRLVASVGRLDSVVVEVTENIPIADYSAALGAIDQVRAAGAAFAVDDAGSGFASLNHVVKLRPDIVKLDRVFVAGCDTDPAKRALIEMMGGLAGQLDAWIIAEGVETLEELQTLCNLRVPLAQGFLLAKPHFEWRDIDPASANQLRAWEALRDDRSTVASICERARAVRIRPEALEAMCIVSPSDVVVALNEWQRPAAVLDGSGAGVVPDPMCVKVGSHAADLLKRALARPAASRFTPLVVVNDLGRFDSIIRFERLVELVAFRGNEG